MFLRKLPSTTVCKLPYRFRLRSVLVAMAFAATLLAWWRDHARLQHQMFVIMSDRANWSAAQVIGEPDTPAYGDIGSAWASSTQAGQTEWLLLTYKEPVVPVAVVIHETYNPEAVSC